MRKFMVQPEVPKSILIVIWFLLVVAPSQVLTAGSVGSLRYFAQVVDIFEFFAFYRHESPRCKALGPHALSALRAVESSGRRVRDHLQLAAILRPYAQRRLPLWSPPIASHSADSKTLESCAQEIQGNMPARCLQRLFQLSQKNPFYSKYYRRVQQIYAASFRAGGQVFLDTL